MSDIDREVAEKVMRWHRRACPAGEEWCSRNSVGNSERQANAVTWSPSTRIDHAWEAVEKMGSEFVLRRRSDSDNPWFAEFLSDPDPATGNNFSLGYGHAETAPLAICKAALAESTPTTEKPNE